MKIKEYRIKSGYNQEQVANILNIHQASYSNKERGTRGFTVEELKKLKELFNVTYDELLS